MPRIPVAVALLALTIAAVGWNMARYPAVWEIVRARESQTACAPQSNSPAQNRSEARSGPPDAAAPRDLALDPETTGAQSLPEEKALGQRAALVVEQSRADACGEPATPSAAQSENIPGYLPAAEQMAAAEPMAPTGPPPATDIMVAAEQIAATALIPACGPAPSALSDPLGAEAAKGGFGCGLASALDRAALAGGPSARVVGIAAVAGCRGTATAGVLPSHSAGELLSASSSKLPPSGLQRLPPVDASQAQLLELPCATPGTPIPVYPSSGID